MKAGFTGTQRGMTPPQWQTLARVVKAARGGSFKGITEWHHGGCIGADEQAHELALSLCIPVWVYPGDNLRKRGKFSGAFVVYPPMDNLERNELMTKTVAHMFACPKEAQEVIRSGTWHCIRRAQKFTEKLTVILPNGQISIHYSKGV